ncbi:MAG TPA: hypothetical protein VFZ48_03695 [Candidatus Saccharimonadales bacterium]
MRIYLQNQSWTTTETVASFNNAEGGAAQWLRGAYHPMGNGYELRVELVQRGKAMIVTRPTGTKKQIATLVVPVVGYSMPIDVEIDETGKPTWSMLGVIHRLLQDFSLNRMDIRVLSEGERFEVDRWHLRELRCSSEATTAEKIPSLRGNALVDAVDKASWVISLPGKKATENPDPEVIVWTHLWRQTSQLEELWAALQEVARKAA